MTDPTYKRRQNSPWMAGCLLFLVGCSSQPVESSSFQSDHVFQPCPESPNCVSSLADDRDEAHYIDPLTADQAAWAALPSVLVSLPNLRVVKADGNYLRAEATTRFLRFVDDLEFQFVPETRIIHVRSASRVGYSDFGVNRERLEQIRDDLKRAVQSP